jgi:hypothetical protein
MAKSCFLLLCCTLFACSVWAQSYASYAIFPQKLSFKKVDLGWKANASYFPKRAWDAGDADSRSILYTGPQKKKGGVDMRLPEFKNKKVDFQFKAGPREPLFRRQ